MYVDAKGMCNHKNIFVAYSVEIDNYIESEEFPNDIQRRCRYLRQKEYRIVGIWSFRLRSIVCSKVIVLRIVKVMIVKWAGETCGGAAWNLERRYVIFKSSLALARSIANDGTTIRR